MQSWLFPILLDCDARAVAALRPRHIEAVNYSVTVAAYGDRFRRVVPPVDMMASGLERRDRLTANATPFRPTMFASNAIRADYLAVPHHERGRVKLAAASASGDHSSASCHSLSPISGLPRTTYLFLDPLPLARRHAAQSRLYRRVVGFRPIGAAVRAENSSRIGLLPFVKRRLASPAPRLKAPRDRYSRLGVAERRRAPVLHGDQFAPDERRVKPSPPSRTSRKVWCTKAGRPRNANGPFSSSKGLRPRGPMSQSSCDRRRGRAVTIRFRAAPHRYSLFGRAHAQTAKPCCVADRSTPRCVGGPRYMKSSRWFR